MPVLSAMIVPMRTALASACLLLSSLASSQEIHLDQNWTDAPALTGQPPWHDAFAMPFVMPEPGYIISVELAMGNSGPTGTVQFAILYPTGPIGSGNFGTSMTGSPVPVIETSTPTPQHVTSNFGLQQLPAGPHWVSLTFPTITTGDPLDVWFMPTVDPAAGLSPCWFHVGGQMGWNAENRAVRFRVNHSNGSSETLGVNCSPGPTDALLTQGFPFETSQSIALNTFVAQSQPFALFLGFTEIPGGLDLGGIGAPSCALFFDPAIAIPAATDANGMWSIALSLPQPVTYFTQCAIVAPGENPLGVVTSNGWRTFTGDGEY